MIFAPIATLKKKIVKKKITKFSLKKNTSSPLSSGLQFRSILASFCSRPSAFV